jgi:hypothetical protein
MRVAIELKSNPASRRNQPAANPKWRAEAVVKMRRIDVIKAVTQAGIIDLVRIQGSVLKTGHRVEAWRRWYSPILREPYADHQPIDWSLSRHQRTPTGERQLRQLAADL